MLMPVSVLNFAGDKFMESRMKKPKQRMEPEYLNVIKELMIHCAKLKWMVNI